MSLVVARSAQQIRRQGAVSVSVALAAGVLLWRLPGVVGTSWEQVGGGLRTVAPTDLTLLALVWFAGLYCYTWVLTASLPGLSHGRALMLNLGGSLVANLLPFGGAAGTALNLAMVRSWNFSTARFATFATVSNLWNLLAKLGLPAAVLVALLAGGTLRSPRLVFTAGTALALFAAIGLTAAAALGSARVAVFLGGVADRACGSCLRVLGSSRTTSLSTRILGFRDDVRAVTRSGWRPLMAGMAGYLALQALLWWMCLQMLGNHLAPVAILAGFAVERALSILPLSPGGVGFAEVGSIAVLVSLTGDPLRVTAAVLLFRVFAFLIEIPVGALALLTWLWTRQTATR
jgi:putative heme transporter